MGRLSITYYAWARWCCCECNGPYSAIDSCDRGSRMQSFYHRTSGHPAVLLAVVVLTLVGFAVERISLAAATALWLAAGLGMGICLWRQRFPISRTLDGGEHDAADGTAGHACAAEDTAEARLWPEGERRDGLGP